jgi:hypothetical protein
MLYDRELASKVITDASDDGEHKPAAQAVSSGARRYHHPHQSHTDNRGSGESDKPVSLLLDGLSGRE